MLVKRDIFSQISGLNGLEALMLWGPRQVGKTTLLFLLKPQSVFYLDDLNVRSRAQNDPAMLLEDTALPCLIDEAQYAPNLFPEIKLRIDKLRRQNLKAKPTPKKILYFITGSNQLLLDAGVKESLAGRAHILTMHGLSLNELNGFNATAPLREIIYRGGFPELHTSDDIQVENFLNGYILSFVEKDVAMVSGVQKMSEFHTVLKLLAARNGHFIQVSEISANAGVEQPTVEKWISALERNFIIHRLAPFHTNLSNRVVKMKKLHFYDSGLCARLQGHLGADAMWNSPQLGGLFESTVFSELTKAIANFMLPWSLHTWRTKEKNEIDFVLELPNAFVFIEAKSAIHGAQSFELDREAKKAFSHKAQQARIVAYCGKNIEKLSTNCTAVPIKQLTSYLLENF